MWVAGRFRIARKRCIREEDYKLNNGLIDSNSTDVFVIVLLVNAIIFIVIGTLREDLLSPGM